MQFQHSDAFDDANQGGRMDLSTAQVQPLRIPRNIKGDSRNGENSDPVQYRDSGHQMVPLKRSDTSWETPPRMDGVMDADTGADGMIPVHEARPRALGQHDAGTQTSFDGSENFWANRSIDLALIPCMWFVHGIEFDYFNQFASHTIIRGFVTSATALAIQIVNYRVLFHIRLGRYLAMAVLIKGIAGLVSSVLLLMDPQANNFGPDIALQLLLAASRAIIGPCFVLLTVGWYTNTNGCSIVRLLLWAPSYPVLVSTVTHITVAADASHRVHSAIRVGLATVCILLSIYIFACVDMPGVTMWLDSARQKSRLQSEKSWVHHRRLPPLRKLVAQSTAWFVLGATFFNAASAPLDGEVFPHFYRSIPSEQAQATFLVLLPFAVFGFLVVTSPITRIPVLVLTASIAYAGRMLIVNHFQAEIVDDDSRFRLDTGELFLRNMIFYWQYLLWAILLLRSSKHDTADSPTLVVNIVVAFAGTALGRLFGYGALYGLINMNYDWTFRESVWEVSTKIFISIIFGLQILVLLRWFLWLVWQRQKRREGQLTPARPDTTAELEC